MAKKKGKWTDWLPSRPFKPNETLRDWSPINNFYIDPDDKTICALCGESTPCGCYDEYYCSCGIKNRECDWPDGPRCPCLECDELLANCTCRKEED